MPCPNSGDTAIGVAGAHRDVGGGGEFALIERLKALLPAPPPGEIWIGDDAAVLEVASSGAAGAIQLVLSTDLSVAGVHGDLALMGVDDFGWRALASALSDLAAMGAGVGHAVIAVAGPEHTDLEALYSGIAAASRAHGCPVVGGDLSSAPVLVVAVTVTGWVPRPPGAVLRSGARPGDALVVTGPLGAAAAGLRRLRHGEPATEAFLHPRARLAQGEAARVAHVSAMIDVSDGLAGDLWHLADASGVGFCLEHVPVAEGATIEDALGGGEDYELVVATADVGALSEEFSARGLPEPLRVGVCVTDPGERTLDGEPLPHIGWQHRF